ncbi:hypothetical protein [Allosphingosinicella deserti]|uniref:DUF465 domain-containing protein n=1 Tax=Allosphingosinicella deserti TaxID=2116704 RepID=A0A2P7QP41_9SPHN|nr:hypothetical protein [Sphingomonas deserti]PSJ39721.1 hypothetical protein C7I55_14135 [Sphingomonas deserti]
MKHFTFSLMLLQQRVDERLRLERQKGASNALVLTLLRQRKKRLAERLKRSLGTLTPVES